MIKTNTQIKIPLSLMFNGKPMEIIERYIDSDRKYLFDELTNQYVNRCLKEIAALAKIEKNITFHTARHTQATYLLSKDVNITTVQKLLGHKKLQTTMIYSKVLDKAVITELKNIKF
jgi:site-specific recombinase XerD